MKLSRAARTVALGIFFVAPLAGCLRSFDYGPNSTGATSNTTLTPMPNMTGSPPPNTTATPFILPNMTVAPVPNTTVPSPDF